MKNPRLAVSDAAAADVLEQADWYRLQAAEDLALRWERAVNAAVVRVLSRPDAGPLCKFRSAELSNVRRTAIAGFPKHLMFYKFDKTEVFILRVVHGARDLERLL
jgi:toxin ParE1/3/4